jgi:hypothetical protein
MEKFETKFVSDFLFLLFTYGSKFYFEHLFRNLIQNYHQVAEFRNLAYTLFCLLL